MQRTSHFTDISGPVHYVDYGGEGPAAVMLHGLGGSHLNWDRIGGGLATEHHAFALDLRGFGLTPLEGHDASMESQVELVASFIRQEASGTATVFGNSMGGTIAMLLAARHPELVERLVLFGPGLPPQSQKAFTRQNLMFLGVPLLPTVGEAAMQRYFDSTPPEDRIELMMQKMTADPYRIDDYTRESLTEMNRLRDQMEWSATAYCQALRSITSVLLRRGSFRRTIHKISAPTLIIHGMLDDTVPFESGEWLARERPDWKLAPIADCGHVPQLELPKRSLELYRDWREQSLVPSTT